MTEQDALLDLLTITDDPLMNSSTDLDGILTDNSNPLLDGTLEDAPPAEEDEEDGETVKGEDGKPLIPNPPVKKEIPELASLEEISIEDDDEPEKPAGENPFEIFAKGLQEEGVWNIEEDPDKIEWNQETFIEKFKESVNNTAWEQLGQLALEAQGEAGKQLVQAIFIDKVPINEYLGSFQEQQDILTLDPENGTQAEKIVRTYLTMMLQEDPDDIQDQINYMKAQETLETKAKSYKSKLIDNQEKYRQNLETQAQARENSIKEDEAKKRETYSDMLKKAVTAGDLGGMPFNQKDADSILSMALDKIHTLRNGQKITDGELEFLRAKAEDPIKYAKILKFIKDGTDTTSIENKGVTNKANSIFSKLNSKAKIPNKQEKKKSAFDLYGES